MVGKLHPKEYINMSKAKTGEILASGEFGIIQHVCVQMKALHMFPISTNPTAVNVRL